MAVRKRKHRRRWEAACRQGEQSVISALQVELRALRSTDPGVTLLTAVEFITADPGRRIALYGRCSAEDRSVNGMGEGDPRFLKIAASSAMDLALLERRTKAEGFRV